MQFPGLGEPMGNSDPLSDSSSSVSRAASTSVFAQLIDQLPQEGVFNTNRRSLRDVHVDLRTCERGKRPACTRLWPSLAVVRTRITFARGFTCSLERPIIHKEGSLKIVFVWYAGPRAGADGAARPICVSANDKITRG
jgi:hypothetical protein